ncbi:hypothetical protein EI94DRAFT_1700170 [Lactarius quietus]|nr:hypothetical protein EI94DRAFT_1700170 [Lactarius quietus]
MRRGSAVAQPLMSTIIEVLDKSVVRVRQRSRCKVQDMRHADFLGEEVRIGIGNTSRKTINNVDSPVTGAKHGTTRVLQTHQGLPINVASYWPVQWEMDWEERERRHIGCEKADTCKCEVGDEEHDWWGLCGHRHVVVQKSCGIVSVPFRYPQYPRYPQEG